MSAPPTSIAIVRERPEHEAAIRALTQRAFADAPHSAQTEAAIVDALRAAGALTVSLVAIDDSVVIGHIAFSAVTIDGVDRGWFGLGPVSVTPERQGEGIGSRLIVQGLDKLKALGAHGCVLLGDPGYYRRFGFAPHVDLTYSGAPPKYFQALMLGERAAGAVAYHAGFSAT